MMKKLMVAAVALFMVVAVTGCGSLRTPHASKNKNYVYYYTFFGLSIESAVYGDGAIVK